MRSKAKTPYDRLEAIEAWSRCTAIAAAIAAGCLMVIAAIAIYVGYDYLQLKGALFGPPDAAGRGPASAAAQNGGLQFDPTRAINDLKSSLTGKKAGSEK